MWNKTNVEDLNKELAEKLKNILWDPSDIDVNWNNFRNILIELRDKFVPHKMSTLRHNLPWYTQKLRRLGKRKQRLYKKSKKSKDKDDIVSFKSCGSEYKRLLKKARQDYYSEFLEPKID